MMGMKKREGKGKLETYGSLLDGSMTYGTGLRLDAWRLVYNFLLFGDTTAYFYFYIYVIYQFLIAAEVQSIKTKGHKNKVYTTSILTPRPDPRLQQRKKEVNDNPTRFSARNSGPQRIKTSDIGYQMSQERIKQNGV